MTKTEAGSVFMIQTKPTNEAPRSPAMAGRGIRAKANKVGRMMFNGKRMFDYLINALIHKYGSSFFALLPFLVEDSSAIGATSAIITCSSLGYTIIFGVASPFRTGACAAVVNECN